MPSLIEHQYRPTRYDYVLTAAILGFFLWLFFPQTHRLLNSQGKALIYEDGQLARQLDLTDSGSVPVRNGRMSLEIKQGRIRVSASDCPGRMCERTGWISQDSQTIVCAPNRLLIVISGRGESPEYDAVSH